MKKKKLITVSILFIPILILYMGWFGYGFISIDDGGQVLDNTKIHSLNFQNLIAIFTSATVSMYQPLTSLSFGFIIELFGLKSAVPFHVFSFLLHCANTFLVFAIGKRLFSNKISPYILPLLFALHPLTVEAVAWVSATSTLLFTLFFLLATLNYQEYLEKENKKKYYYSLLFFLLGCFAKVQIVPFVGVLFLLDYLNEKPLINKKNILNKIPFFIIAPIFAYITSQYRGEGSGFTQDYNPIFLAPI
jgi:hypothetical protein